MYSKSDLYGLWLGFRGQHDEVRVLQDFALCSKQEAEALIAEFELHLECSTLDGDHRGKADQTKTVYTTPKKKRGRPPKAKKM